MFEFETSLLKEFTPLMFNINQLFALHVASSALLAYQIAKFELQGKSY